MEQTGHYRGLEERLDALSVRIRFLRDKVERTEGIDKIEGHAEIGQLELRYKQLEARMLELNRQGTGFRQGLRNEIEKLTYDVSSAVEDFMMLIDAGYHRRGKQPASKQ